MSGSTLSEADAKELRRIIDHALATPHSPASSPVAVSAGSLDFCSIWPEAKPVLQTLSGIAALIPGLGPAATASLTGLIAVGDVIHKQTCS